MDEVERTKAKIDMMLSELRAMCIHATIPGRFDLTWNELEEYKKKILREVEALHSAILRQKK